MVSPSRRPTPLAQRILVVVQVLLLISMLFVPLPVAAEDPAASGDPGASAPPSTEPAPTPDPTPEATPEPPAATPDPTPEPPAATPDPTPEPPAVTPDPTAEPTVAPDPSADPTPDPSVEPPAATPEPTPETPAATPEPTPEPTPAPTTEPSSAPVGNPTIASDQADYAPGSLVTLTGTGWQPGESVHIFVNDDFGSSWSRNVDVVADASGAIADQFNLPNWFVATYTVLATGSVSGNATTSFTDASLVIKRGPVGSPPDLKFTVTFQRGFSTSACSGTGGTSDTEDIVDDAGENLTGLGSGAFVKVTAPLTATSPSGYTFKEWTAEGDSPTTGFPKTSLSICVRNPGGSLNDVYRANYIVANHAPDAVNDSPTVAEDSGANTVNVLANDTDPDNLSAPFNFGLTVIATGSASHGTVAIAADNLSVTYTPTANYFGSDSFTYTISDNGTNAAGHTDTATVSVTITPVNDAPVVVLSGNFSDVDEGTTRTYTYTITDIDSSSHLVTETCGSNATYVPDTFDNSFDCKFREGPGDSTVKVTANDLEAVNNIGEDAEAVDVDNLAPTVTLTGPATANEGDTKSYSYSWTDPGTDDTFPALGNSISCGVHGSASDVVFTPASKTGSFKCTWSDDSGSGTADVKATVTDDDGGADDDTIHVDVDNLAPTVTSLTASPSAVIVGQTIVVTGTATDPSSLDTAAGFQWSFNTGAGYGGYSSSNTVSKLVTACGPITIKAQARDKDGGVSAEATVTVQTFDGAFLSPLKEGVSNLVQKGRVVPVQISFGCGGAITGLHPEIQLLKGDFVANAGTEGSGDNLVTESVSSADTGNVMRELSGKYIYNLAIPSSGMNAGQALTVRVRPYGPNTQPTMYILLEIRK